MPFKVPFDIFDYKQILPVMPASEKDVLNYQHAGRGDYDKCVWKREVPKEITGAYMEQEVERVLRDGVWAFIKDEIVWLAPNYYFALQYGRAGADDIQFRVKRLKHTYFKIESLTDKFCRGTLTLKNRADGETTMAVTDGFWRCLYGNMDVGQVAIQSKTRSDAQTPCWAYVQNLWQNLPLWFKKKLCPDFASDGAIAEKMQWLSNADENTGKKGRNVLYKYYPSGHNAMDGQHNLKDCILDEICKWKECDFAPTLNNYTRFIMPGLERRGFFDMFSSPADFECKSNDQVAKLWDKSDPENIQPNGSTESQIRRFHSDPLEGMQGTYDKWGDSDANVNYEEIMRTRRAAEPEDYLGVVRGNPLNRAEMFESAEDGRTWDNYEGIKKRATFVSFARFKNEQTKEIKGQYGILEWDKGREDTEVFFRASDKQKFDNETARFFITHQPVNRVELKDVFTPPRIITDVLGVDPYGTRHPKGKSPSKGGAINYKFADLGDNLIDVPTLAYLARPYNEKIFYEDMIMAAVFNRAMIQYENITPGISEYIIDRGYKDWLLASLGEKQGSIFTGDGPKGGSGKNTLLDKMLLLINSFTNKPISLDQVCLLENVWIYELLEDLLAFNPNDTHKSDLSMAFGMSLIGAGKLLRRPPKKQSTFNNKVMSYMIG